MSWQTEHPDVILMDIQDACDWTVWKPVGHNIKATHPTYPSLR